MKVISLLQPWATLVVIGAKKIETRSWNTNYRGPLLIHASKKMDGLQKALCETVPFKTALETVEELPLGQIIGSVHIEHVLTTEKVEKMEVFRFGGSTKWSITEQEKAFGDYGTGRYAWMLSNPVHFTEHRIQIKGSLGLWEFDERICLQCGCTENDACFNIDHGPCWWVGQCLCSHCKLGINKKETPVV